MICYQTETIYYLRLFCNTLEEKKDIIDQFGKPSSEGTMNEGKEFYLFYTQKRNIELTELKV
jgi:hypothetical protein